MGFWKTLGKIGLKVAPYAAMAIPGVGVPLGMAIAGATGAASKKLSGGSWKDSLLSGGIDAGLAGVGGGFAKGIGPTAGAVGKAAGKTTVKGVLKNVGTNMLGDMAKGGFTGGGTPGATPPFVPEKGRAGGGGWQDMVGSVLGNYRNMMDQGGGAAQRAPQPQQAQQAVQRPGTGLGPIMPRGGYGYDQNPMNQLNQSNPNLSQSIFQGRQAAMRPRRRY